MASPSPPVRKNDPVHVQNMMRKYKIRFLGPADTLFDKPWPANLGATFDQVKRLGVTDYDTYTEDVRADVEQQQPWRYQRLRQARTLFQTAGECIRNRATEQGWRLEVEQLVCGRFSVEVACKTCRGRLWKSEEEVAPDGNSRDEALDREGLPSLRARQEHRKPCKCPPYTFRSDLEDSGINPLFERRAEMAIAYTEEMKRDLRRRRNRPDRIIGLSKSRTIERLLWKPDQRQASPYTTVEASIRTTPFKQDGKPVLFPFLIIEAKSEKSGTAFTDIDMQTAFAMRELVLLQEELRRNASGRGYDSWEAGPLVWYFSYRGEQWRLHGAYPRPNGATGAVDVVRLWSGDIDSARGALQLLLLVDYICDWARDKYRESVIQSLASFSQSDRQVTVASDILSLRAPTTTPAPTLPPRTPSPTPRPHAMEDTLPRAPQSKTGSNENHGPRCLYPKVLGQLGSLPLHDSPVRDIRLVKSRIEATFITKEYLNLSRRVSPHSFRRHFIFLNTAWEAWGFSTTLRGLDEAQVAWNKGGNPVQHIGPDITRLGNPRARNARCIVIMACKWYVSHSWQPVRVLEWVAIEESAIQYLIEATGTSFSVHKSKYSGDFKDFFCPYTELSARLKIAACLLDASVVLDPVKNESSRIPTWCSEPSLGYYSNGRVPLLETLHSEYEKERLGSCPTHRGNDEHMVSRTGRGVIAEQKVFYKLFRLLPDPFEKSALGAGSPLLVIDPVKVDPATKLPAHCTFAEEDNPHGCSFSNLTGNYKMYLVAERLSYDTMPSWAGFTHKWGITEQTIRTKSGIVRLVQLKRSGGNRTSRMK